MGIIINQGVHDTTKDSMFEPITEKNVMMVIKKITTSSRLENSIDVTFQILNGKNKNRYIFDTVTYDPNSNWAWKYRALRKAAGVPYSKGESKKIDIEDLLLNKAVLADLSTRTSNKPDDDRVFQNVTYRVSSKTTDAVSKTKKADEDDNETAVDLDDLDGMESEDEEVEETVETADTYEETDFDEEVEEDLEEEVEEEAEDDFEDEAEELEEEEAVEEEVEEEPEPEPKPQPKKKKASTLSTKTKTKKTTKKKAEPLPEADDLPEDDLPDAFGEDAVTIDDDDDEWE